MHSCPSSLFLDIRLPKLQLHNQHRFDAILGRHPVGQGDFHGLELLDSVQACLHTGTTQSPLQFFRQVWLPAYERGCLDSIKAAVHLPTADILFAHVLRFAFEQVREPEAYRFLAWMLAIDEADLWLSPRDVRLIDSARDAYNVSNTSVFAFERSLTLLAERFPDQLTNPP